jgi:hypothetical protein
MKPRRHFGENKVASRKNKVGPYFVKVRPCFGVVAGRRIGVCRAPLSVGGFMPHVRSPRSLL